MPTLILDINPFGPLERHVERIPKNRKIAAMAPKCDYPVICLYNGRPLLRAGWKRRVRHGDVIAFVARPRGGGGGGGLLRIAATFALAVAAPWAATAMGFSAGTLGFAMVSAAISVVGGLVLNAMLPGPRLPQSQAVAADIQAASPTYSLGAQGNAARLEQPIPVQYGRLPGYLDFAATPYQEYADNEQWLYQLFVVGQGHYDVEAVRIEDTPLAQFEGATAEVVPPGGRVALFPAAVVQSIEVSGGELGSLGPFVAVPSGSQANYIGVDLVCPGGIYYANDAGGLDALSLSVRFEARQIDDVGAPVGGWVTLGTETISGATNTAIRRSYRYAVTPGRYEVKAVRTDSKDTRSRAAHTVQWAGLRAYLPDTTDFGNVTMLAVRLKATSQLSSQASRKINVISTRKLPVWNPTTGWSAPVATRSIAWALADICRASYGANLADDAYDLAGLYVLDQVWSARGDTFDARFDTKSTVGEALTLVALAGRTKWYQQLGQVRFWRDQLQTLPVMIFKPRNIAPGSFRLHYAPAVTDTADSVRASYFDERYWSQRDVTAVPAGSAGASPRDVKLYGVVKRDQAVNEARHMAECNLRRRLFVSWETEAEGRLLRYGDLVGVVHDMPGWGQSGDCIGWEAASRRLVLSEPPVWTDGGNHYVSLSRPDGSVTNKIQVSKDVLYDNAVILAEAPDFEIETSGATRIRTTYAFGTANSLYMEALVSQINAKGKYGTVIEAVIEDRAVHSPGGTVSPDLGGMPLPVLPSAPVVSSLSVVEGGTPDAPVQNVSWPAAPGASHYVAEYTMDGGQTWTKFAETVAASAVLSRVPRGQALNIRVAGVGLLRGAWKYWNGVSGAAVAAPGGLVDLALESAFVGPEAVIKWSPVPRADKYRVEVWAGGSMRRQVFVVGTRFAYTVDDAKQDGGPWRSLTFWVTPMGIGAGPASSVAAFNQTPGQLNNILVSATTGGALWSSDASPDPDVVGYLVYASTLSGFTPGPSNLVGEFSAPVGQLSLPAGYTWRLRFAAVDRWGRDNLNISGEFSVSPGKIVSTQISEGAVLTPHLGAGTVTAEKMQVARLSAVATDLGTINTGAFNVTSDGVGGYGYARSAGKWWGDGANGWIFARNVAGDTFAEIKAGAGRLWFSNWGDYGIQMPGISMGPSGVTLSQLNVIGTSQIQGNAVTLSSAASGGGGASLTITVPPEASGQPVIVLCSGTNNQDGAGGYRAWNTRRWYRLYRNGVELRLVRDIQENATFAAHDLATAFTHLDYPVVGTHTYTLWVRNWNDSDVAWGTSVNIVCSLGKR